jgi:2-polyprenyl-6-methoxyphenol hydroxylase-like FAD-dependent oxidoreductase
LICGAGIGGLTTALALHKIGIDVTVFESAPEIRALGVGINLLPHAVRVLHSLGLQEPLADNGIATGELEYYTKRGQRIWSEPRGIAAGYRWPQYSIHRGRLLELLWRAVCERLGEQTVRAGHRLATFEHTADRVTATFVNRLHGGALVEDTGDVLVGADGIHSVVRATFYPQEGEPKSSGRLLWRAVSEAEPYLTGRTMIMAGHADQKFVCYPICPQTATRGRALINWIAELNLGEGARLPRRDWNRRGDKATFAPAFADWRFPFLDIPALIESAAEVFEFPMVDRDPVPRWSFGRVTLLGDAAHPMYPIGSNGASQAILDAEAVADSLRDVAAADLAGALRSYEQKRLAPTAEIVRSNRRMGPEVVLQMVEERAPNGFAELHDVISREELEAAANSYKRIAGFDRETLNRCV